MADLPDYYTQAQISEAEAASVKGGLDANKSATPVSRQIYFATDTGVLYICVLDGTWTGFDASILTQGTLTLYENMNANSKKITSLAAPTAANDAVRKTYADGLITTHAGLTTGIHGVGASTIAKLSDVTTHAALTTAHGSSGAVVGATTLGAAVSAHAGAATAIHGVGASTVASVANITTHAAIKAANATLGHVIVETASEIDVDASGKLTLGGITAFLEGAPTEDLATKAPTSEWAFDHAALTAAHGAVSAATASKMVVRDASARAKFAAPAASGDVLIKGTRVTVAELPAMADERIWKGTGGNVEEIDLPVAGGGARLVATQLQDRVATGDFSSLPASVWDGNTGTLAVSDTISQYSEILFDSVCWITQYRQYGRVSNNGDGSWKIRRLNPATDTWVDWITGIATRATGDWSNWASDSTVLASGLRLVTTAIDTGLNDNRLQVMEVKY